jgi:hypothetical protein
MAYFEYEGEIDISVNDFLRTIDQREKEDLIKQLILDGSISKKVLASMSSIHGISAPESEFEEALGILHSKWSRLSKEDEEAIIRVANKF